MDLGDEDEDDEKVCICAVYICSPLLPEYLYFYMQMNRK